MIEKMLNVHACKNHTSSVKLRAGASLVKKKLVFSFDSRFILVPNGCDVKVFSIASGECTLIFKEHQKSIIGVQISKKNSLQALSCSEDSTVLRWDYSDGTVIMKYQLKMYDPCTFIASTPTVWFFTSKFKDQYRIYSIKVESPLKHYNVILHLKDVQAGDNSLAVGHEASYVAAVCGNSLQVKDIESKTYKRHLIGERKFSCIAAHPTEYILATGDNLGRIMVWSNFFESCRPTRSIYHWHSLPLNDLVFSLEGSHIYSGGGESVLVKWNLNTDTKQMLPRLGLPINRIAVSPDNTFIASSHVDNAIQIISSQNKIVQIIQGLTQGNSYKISGEDILPTGIVYDPRLNAVIMNGRPGHLQFYNINDDRQLFNLDIVGQNYISQERESIIVNTDIERAAIDSKGLWLATVECRDDGETSIEIRLKFWKFEMSSQRFVLNTNVFLPHRNRINSLKFRTVINEESENLEALPLAVTTSNDGRFKIWTLSEANTNDKKSNWTCELMGYYKELPAGDACFSEDGSLLSVAFNHILTLWSPEANVLKATLSKSENTDLIKHIEFGKGKCSHLLVAHSDLKVTVWDVLSLSVLWNVNCGIQVLTADSFSEVMALFSKDNALYIFKPSDPNPIFVLKNVSPSPVVAAIFIPKTSSNSVQEKDPCCWQKSTKLFFLNQDQEVFTVTDESESIDETDVEKIKLQQNIPVTPFGLLQAETTVSHVQSLKPKKHIFYEFGKEENVEISDLPCPSNVNPIALCKALLPSLLIRRHSNKQEMSSKVKKESNSESSDSETDFKPEIVTIQQTSKQNVQIIEPMDVTEFILPELEDFKYLSMDPVRIIS